MTEIRERYLPDHTTTAPHATALTKLLALIYAAGLSDGYRESHALADITCPPDSSAGTFRCSVTCACGQTFDAENWLPSAAIAAAIRSWKAHRDGQAAVVTAPDCQSSSLRFRAVGRDLYAVTSPLSGAEYRLHANGRVTCNCRCYAERGRCEHADALRRELAEKPRCANCGQLDLPWDRVTVVREYDAERDDWHPVHRCADRNACQRRRDEGARAFLARYGLAVGVRR